MIQQPTTASTSLALLVLVVIISLARIARSGSTAAVMASPKEFLQAAPDHIITPGGNQTATATEDDFDRSVTFWMKASFSPHSFGQQLLFETGSSTTGLSLTYGSDDMLSLALCRADRLNTMQLSLPASAFTASAPLDVVISLDRSKPGVEVQRLWAGGEMVRRITSTNLPWGPPGTSPSRCGYASRTFKDGAISVDFGFRFYYGWAFFPKPITINDRLLESPWERIGQAPDLRVQQSATFPTFSGESRFAPKPDASLSPFVLQLSTRLFPKTHGSPEILFEVGGLTFGLTLAYVPPNTIILHHCSSHIELTVKVPDALLGNTAPYADIIVSRSRRDELLLSVSGISTQKSLPGDDIAGGSDGGFLQPAGQVCGVSNAMPFSSGTPDLQLGLNFWVDEVYTPTLQTQIGELQCEFGEMIIGSDGLFRCLCAAGYTGTLCADDIDECAMANSCQAYANCTNTEGSFECTCIDGFEGNGFSCVSTQPPTIQCPQNVVIAESYPAIWPQPLISDDVDAVNDLRVACNPPSGTTNLGIGSHNVTCTVTDTNNKTASCSFSLTRLDNTAPVFDVCPSRPIVLQLDPGSNTTRLAYDEPQARDNHATHVQVTCSPSVGIAVQPGYTPVSCLARDGRQGTTCSFNVKVEDHEPPALVCPNDVHVAIGANSSSSGGRLPTVAEVQYGMSTARDNVNGFLPVKCWPPSGSAFPVGQRSIVACRAADTSGNEASCTFSVTVDMGTTTTTTTSEGLAVLNDSIANVSVGMGATAVTITSKESALLKDREATAVIVAAALLAVIVLVFIIMKAVYFRRKHGQHRTTPVSPDAPPANTSMELQSNFAFDDSSTGVAVKPLHTWDSSLYDIVNPEEQSRSLTQGPQECASRIPSNGGTPPVVVTESTIHEELPAKGLSSTVSSASATGRPPLTRVRDIKKLQSRRGSADTTPSLSVSSA